VLGGAFQSDHAIGKAVVLLLRERLLLSEGSGDCRHDVAMRGRHTTKVVDKVLFLMLGGAVGHAPILQHVRCCAAIRQTGDCNVGAYYLGLSGIA
jgi:hypothetical protein